MKYLIATGVGVLLAAGCASAPPPNDQLAAAIASTRGAEEAGARGVPRAALQLKLAEEAIVEARAMMEDGENERAELMSLRAHNDAELALALAREDAAVKRAGQGQAAAIDAATRAATADAPNH